MRIVEGPASVGDDRWILSLNRPDAGVAAAAARPASEAFWSIGAAVHRALGQQPPLLTTTTRDRELLAVWVAAYWLDDVIVHHADRYPASVLLDVDALVTAAGARLWVVVDASVHPLVVQEVADLAPVDAVDWSTFRSHWSPIASMPVVAPEGAATRLDPVAAWAAQHERLVRATGRGMDLPYLEGFCAAAGWARSERPRKTEVAAKVRACLERYEDPECFVQATRGVAVALHELGWQVTLDLATAGRAAAGAPLTRPVDIARLADVRAFREPMTGAATGLASLEISRDEILGLELDDVSADGATLELWHDVVAVPAVLRRVLRAQRVWRLRHGALATDAFLADGPAPLSTRRFTSLVLAGLEEVGRGISRVELDARPSADERWLLERGVALGWVSRLDRRSIGPSGMSGAATLAAVVGRLRRPDRIDTRPSCRCQGGHRVPNAPTPGTWPPTRLHAPVPADHPWRR